MNFRKSLLGLAGAAIAFSGAAYGQNGENCTTAAGSGLSVQLGPQFIRAEGQTEQLPPITLTCANTAGQNNMLTVTLFVSPGTTITSKLLNSSTGQTEALATVGGTPAVTPGSNSTSVLGTTNGSSLVFTGIATTGTTTTITFNNIRIDATKIPTAAGAPPTPITVQAFVSGSGALVNGNVPQGQNGVIPGATNQPQVAFALAGLGTSTVTKNFGSGSTAGTNPGTFAVCTALSAQSNSTTPTPAFFVNVNENFQNAFKALGVPGNAVANPVVTAVTGESSQVSVTAGGINNNANSGTRVKLTFSNIPAGGLQIYLPVQVIASDGAVLTLQGSETGSRSDSTAITGQSNISSISSGSTANGSNGIAGTFGTGSASVPFGVSQVTVSGTGAQAVYEVTTDNQNVIDNFSIPVFLISGTNALSAQSATLQVVTSLAPVTAATTIPSFSGTTSATTLSTVGFGICQTSLLFPFITNQNGFETGIAISNTSKDPIGNQKPQTGICTLNYYGQSQTNPAPTQAPNFNEGPIGGGFAGGESYAFTLTSALAVGAGNPATFQGYMIAVCGFQDAHGFAYIAYQFPGTSSSTMGYLALVINNRGGLSVGTQEQLEN